MPAEAQTCPPLPVPPPSAPVPPPAATPPRDPFRVGALLLWLWPLPHDPAAAAAEAVALGCTGVIPQQGSAATAHVVAHRAVYEARGLDIVVGLGSISVDAICAGLATGCPVLLDEEAWHTVADAAALTAGVLARYPQAPLAVTDAMYPAVVSTRDGHATGHGPITRAFNTLCATLPRFPQCYWEAVPGSGQTCAPDGWVARDLAWARDASQWPAIGVSAARVRPAVQMYRRSVTDHVLFLLAELATGAVALWDLGEMDASCKVALLVIKALRLAGYTGPDALRMFQRSENLATDNTVGPATCAALGIPVPAAGVVWHHP